MVLIIIVTIITITGIVTIHNGGPPVQSVTWVCSKGSLTQPTQLTIFHWKYDQQRTQIQTIFHRKYDQERTQIQTIFHQKYDQERTIYKQSFIENMISRGHKYKQYFINKYNQQKTQTKTRFHPKYNQQRTQIQTIYDWKYNRNNDNSKTSLGPPYHADYIYIPRLFLLKTEQLNVSVTGVSWSKIDSDLRGDGFLFK